MTNMTEKARALQKDLVAIRRELHQHAESGFDLPRTISQVKGELTAAGIAFQEIGNSGLTALIGPESTGSVFLLRADMDGLPISEAADLGFRSETGNMHACGHDLHTTMLLGAARLLKAHESELKGRVKLLFQPAEELLRGASSMVEAGILENPDVDAGMMLHVLSDRNIPTGKALIMQEGPILASHDRFEITIRGKGCHGAMPNTGVDPLVAMSNIHLAIHEIYSREIGPDDFLVATVGQMTGGATANVIPDSAYMQGTIRTYDPSIRELSKERIEELAVSIAQAYRCRAEVTFHSPCPAMQNDPALREATKRYAGEVFGEDEVIDLGAMGKGRMSASEDFAFIASRIPAAAVMISSSNTDGEVYPMHHPKVTFDESVLSKGAALLAHSAMSWLEEHQ